ncbi:G-type lectin S-receptor-like serine/threonine-protein kinase At4g27290 [Linum grandiflorum]
MESLMLLLLVLPVVYILILPSSSFALEVVTPTQPLIDSDAQTLQSKAGIFELGFFTPGGVASKNRYLGIWYRNIADRRVVWVANRGSPATDNFSSLIIDTAKKNSLVLVSRDNKTVFWSTSEYETSKSDDALTIPTNPVAELLDTGNLVLRDQNDEKGNYFWQSFDYPCDTLLPGMKQGWDSKTGLNRRLTSWKSPVDPSLGDFTWGFQVHQANPEAFMWKGSEKVYRSGPWNGLGFSTAPELRANPVFSYTFVWDDDNAYYTFQLKNESLISIVVMNQTSYTRQRLVWSDVTRTWGMFTSTPRDRCDNYAICGVYAACTIFESPICQCLKGFKPKSQEMWDMLDWSQGCVRDKPLECSEDGFIKYTGLKLPDATNSWVDKSMSLEECRVKCLMNCSCMAYTSTDIRGAGSGCSIWYGDLTDMTQFIGGGQELYIRMPASEIESKNKVKTKVGVIVGAAIVSLLGLLALAYFIHKMKSKWRRKASSKMTATLGRKDEVELPLFERATIADATDNFSFANKLGEGGFGPVYKGVMGDGQEIAVKRLSSSSGQGTKEFKNEVLLISKLQHRNLVKLLGCCLQGDEKMLVYEYMPNKGLDSFIFDDKRSRLLDWGKRFNIICGIARGLLYLHQDSRLRIIHRDLKASNVLLDNELNPKISDFGMARSFGGDNTEGNTNRVVGTYGYMAPEYAADGLFSVKSDVFSFGILVLEIISRKKSRGFYHTDQNMNLSGYAWRLWKEGKALQIMDSVLEEESCENVSQVMKCIHIGLLCVQNRADDRPSIGNVVLMLGGGEESAALLPPPKEPGFFNDKDPLHATESSSSTFQLSSTNEMSVTVLKPR